MNDSSIVFGKSRGSGWEYFMVDVVEVVFFLRGWFYYRIYMSWLLVKIVCFLNVVVLIFFFVLWIFFIRCSLVLGV